MVEQMPGASIGGHSVESAPDEREQIKAFLDLLNDMEGLLDPEDWTFGAFEHRINDLVNTGNIEGAKAMLINERDTLIRVIEGDRENLDRAEKNLRALEF